MTMPDDNTGDPQRWENRYITGETPWERGGPSPPLVQWLSRNKLAGRVLVPGCGRGHDVSALAAAGCDVTGLDVAPTAVRDAKGRHPSLAGRFVVGNLFDLPAELRGAFDAVVEHTCLSGLHPSLREKYRQGVLDALRPGGLLAGVWFINPALDPGETGPPFAISLPELDQLFGGEFEVIEDYTPDAAYPGREGRERVRVMKRKG